MRTALEVGRRFSTRARRRVGSLRAPPELKKKAPRVAGLSIAGRERDQPFGLSFAASALMTWKRLSSEPAMPTSVMYLPFTITVGVPVIR